MSPIILSVMMIACAPTSDTDAVKRPPKPGYELVWADEFDGASLDRTKWDYRNLGPRREAVNVRETVRLDGKGNLELSTRRKDGRIETAMIGTQGKFETTYGYFECRVHLQETHGNWSAFWLQSPTVGEVGDPGKNGTEIDIYECFEVKKELVSHNLHWDGYGEHHQHAGSGHLKVPGLTEGYHVFALEWTPDEYIFYVNGQVNWRSNQAVSHRPEYIILSLEVGPKEAQVVRSEPDFTDRALFDYVRVYQKKDPAARAE